MNINEQIEIVEKCTAELAREIATIKACAETGYLFTAIETITAAENCQRQIARALRGMRESL